MERKAETPGPKDWRWGSLVKLANRISKTRVCFPFDKVTEMFDLCLFDVTEAKRVALPAKTANELLAIVCPTTVGIIAIDQPSGRALVRCHLHHWNHISNILNALIYVEGSTVEVLVNGLERGATVFSNAAYLHEYALRQKLAPDTLRNFEPFSWMRLEHRISVRLIDQDRRDQWLKRRSALSVSATDPATWMTRAGKYTGTQMKVESMGCLMAKVAPFTHADRNVCSTFKALTDGQWKFPALS